MTKQKLMEVRNDLNRLVDAMNSGSARVAVARAVEKLDAILDSFPAEPAVTNSTALLIEALRKNTPSCGGMDGDKPCEDFADYKVEWSDRSARVCGMHLEQARGWARNDGSGDRTDNPSIENLESGAVAREAIRAVVESEKS